LSGFAISSGAVTTDLRPAAVLIQADVRRLGAAVSVDPDRPWYRFLDELQVEHRYSAQHLSRVRDTWEEIRAFVGDRLPLPVTQSGAEGAIQLYWDNKRKYVEVDVLADGTLHWFYKDRSTEARDGTEDEPVRGVPSHLLARLVEFVS
jgi:hypothetical protein